MAKRTAKISNQCVWRWLRSRGPRQPFSIKDGKALARNIEHCLADVQIRREAGSTLALCVAGPRSAIVIWVGDSHIYHLDETGALILTTDDHIDKDGALIRYISGQGTIRGGLSVKVLESTRFSGWLATSDGVHEACTLEELRAFTFYSMYENPSDSKVFEALLNRFIGRVAHDNYSAALTYRVFSRYQIEKRSRG